MARNWFRGHPTLFTQISRPKENRRHVKHKVVYTLVAQEMFKCCYDSVAKILKIRFVFLYNL